MKYKRGKSICIFSTKGGVGKTTNILNLAGIYEQLEKRVLIIDMDLYTGGMATYLNTNFKESIYNLVEDMSNNIEIDIRNYIVKVDNYIDLLCAPKDPRYSNKIDTQYIEDIIKNAKTKYDIILIDTNHALNDINLVTLGSVDQILFFVTNDPLDLKNMKSLLTIFNSLDINNYSLLLNNSRDPFKNYFGIQDIEYILKNKITYTLSSELFIKDIEKYIMSGTIISLDKKFPSVMQKDYRTFLKIATDMLDKEEEHEQ